MVIDKIVEKTIEKKNPCIVGLDPEWEKIPECYKHENLSKTTVVKNWAIDIIDTVKDIVVAIKPQMAFFEVFGYEGYKLFQEIVQYAHSKGLIVIDDSKRNDIGNTARAYAYAHLAKAGPINADFLTVSPFLGTDSIQPFVDTAFSENKGIFVLVKTSNPSSGEISDSINSNGEKVSEWLAKYINDVGRNLIGESGYSSIGAVVGATYPKEAKELRKIMKSNYFLVPGFGAQGGNKKDIATFFNEDGLGALISSSRAILYSYPECKEFDNSKSMYLDIVKNATIKMQQDVYEVLKSGCSKMKY